MDKDRKDLREELNQLAGSILNADKESLDLERLKKECLAIYEKLTLLGHFEMKQEPVEKVSKEVKEDHLESSSNEEKYARKDKVKAEEEQEYPTLSDLFVPTFNDIKEDMSQKEEFKDTVSLEETEKLFETKREEIRQLSLNDRLLGSSIQVGLNDRIAFVNKLFNFSQSDFNKVLTKLNDCTTREEALHYVQYQVKTNYNWKGKEELEERFISLIERKFMT